MPVPIGGASTSGSARQSWLRRHCVAVTPVVTCSDHDGSPLGSVARRHGFPVGQHPYHRSSTGGRSRRLPASRRDGHERRTGGGGMRRVEPCQTPNSWRKFSRTSISWGGSQPPWEIVRDRRNNKWNHPLAGRPPAQWNHFLIKNSENSQTLILKPSSPYRPRSPRWCRPNRRTTTPPHAPTQSLSRTPGDH